MKKYILITTDGENEGGTIYRIKQYEELSQAYGNLIKIGVTNGYIVKLLNPKVIEND